MTSPTTSRTTSPTTSPTTPPRLGLWDRSQVPGERADAPAIAAPDAHGSESGGSRRWRRWLLVAVAIAAVVTVVTLFVVAGPGSSTTIPLDPDNPTASGAQAVARVLEQQGVRVQVARGQTELDRAGADGDTTVVVTRTAELAESTTRDLAVSTSGAGRLVVLGAESSVTRYLAPGVSATSQRRSGDDLVATGCSGTDDVRGGESLSRSQLEYQSASANGSCFTHDGHSVYLSLPRSAQTAPLVLIGSTSIATNDQVTDASNAAVLLRALGHFPRLVWYVPSRADIPASDQSPAALLPRWLGPGLLLVVIAFVGVIVWRGRRLGRLVPEPLPVVVRAVETTESRGRLYRRARDSTRAAAVLQQATRTRLTAYLGLPVPGPRAHTGADSGADPWAARAAVDGLVAAASLACGRPTAEVGALLFGPPPATDDHLLGLAIELVALEKEVRRS